MMTKEMRDAVLRRWVDEQTSPALTPSLPASPPAAFDLSGFVQKVQAAAENCTSGRFGNNKVFVIHVWRALQNDAAFNEMDLAAFKRHLAEANNARLLDLSRADLVQAMDPDDVRLSEVSYLNATFHFIRIGSERH